MDDARDGRSGLDRTHGLGSRVRWLVWNGQEARLRSPLRLLVGAIVLAVLALLVGLSLRLVDPMAVAAGSPVGSALVVTGLYLVAMAVFVGGLFGLGHLIDRREIQDFGLGVDRRWWRDLGFGLALGVALPTVLFLVEWLAGLVTVTGIFVSQSGAFLSLGAAPVWVGLLSMALVFVGVGVFEELLVRGYLLTNVAEGLADVRGLGQRSAVVGATVLTAGCSADSTPRTRTRRCSRPRASRSSVSCSVSGTPSPTAWASPSASTSPGTPPWAPCSASR